MHILLLAFSANIGRKPALPAVGAGNAKDAYTSANETTVCTAWQRETAKRDNMVAGVFIFIIIIVVVGLKVQITVPITFSLTLIYTSPVLKGLKYFCQTANVYKLVILYFKVQPNNKLTITEQNIITRQFNLLLLKYFLIRKFYCGWKRSKA